MRNNQPVTDREHLLREGASIVSKTDLKGHITYVNPAFVEISGYTEEELLGQPHNLIRHPDMPAVAFADLWNTVRSGAAWSGVVKNRCKNGDYYWVLANVTPIREAGRITGFLSVRVRPSREQISGADALYAAIRTGRAGGIEIRGGHVIPSGFGRLWNRYLEMPLAGKIGLNLGLNVLALAVEFLLALTGHSSTALTLFLSGLGIVLCGALWFVLGKAILSPLKRVTDAALAVSSGDIAQQISTRRRDDFGHLVQALRQMSINLVATIGDVRANVSRIAASTRQLSDGTAALSDRTASQAASLEETASSLEELSSTVKMNAERAAESRHRVSEAASVAEQGGRSVAKVEATMHEITAQSKKIAAITKLIDEIAFQTNILALNAAVEAARAGDHGAGFAVVADEVRSLAHRSAEAAREIDRLIEESNQKVALGNALVGEANATMVKIVDSAKGVAASVAEIATATEEQSQGVGQINIALAQVDQLTQQNATMVNDSLAETRRLEEQIRQLSEAVSIFHLGNAGEDQDAIPFPATSTKPKTRAMRLGN